MTTNTGIWTGWNNFYGSGDYAITDDTLNISTDAANMSALLYWATVAKPGERITIEYDARTISGVGRITASSRVAYTAYNTQLVENHSDFRSYTFDVEVPTKVAGPQLVFFGVGIWRGDNTTAGAEVEFVLRNVIRHDAGGRQMMRPDTFGLLEPETRLILNSLLEEPNKAYTQSMDDTIYQLKQAGIWQKLDCLYLLAAPSAGVAAVNWVNPGQYNLKEVNSPTFTANQGYSGRVDAVTPPYLQTSFNPVALEGTDDDGNGVADEPWAAQFRMDNNSMFVWATYVEDTSAYIIGTRAHAIAPFPTSYATRVYARDGAESGDYVSGVARESGLYAMSRTNSADFDIYANGISAGNVAQASGTMYSESIQILKRSANSETCNGNIIRAAGFGAALTAQEQSDLYRIIAIYMEVSTALPTFVYRGTMAGMLALPAYPEYSLAIATDRNNAVYQYISGRWYSETEGLGLNLAGLNKFSALMGEVETRALRVICVGDSVTFDYYMDGTNTTPDDIADSKGWVGRLRTRLARLHGAPEANSISGYDTRIVTAGSPAANPSAGLNRRALALTGAGQTGTWNLPAGTRIRISWYENDGADGGANTGSFSYSVDGGGAVTVANSGLANTYRSVAISGLSEGAHTVLVSHVSGLNYICSVSHDSEEGVLCGRFGRSGWTSFDIMGIGVNNNLAVPGPSRMQASFYAQEQPDLAIYAFGRNDCTHQAVLQPDGRYPTPTAYKANAQAFINAVTAGGGCVLLLSTPAPTDDTVAGASGYYHRDYWAVNDQLAAENANVATIRITDFIGNHTAQTANGLLDATSLTHNSVRGASRWAQIVYCVLTQLSAKP